MAKNAEADVETLKAELHELQQNWDALLASTKRVLRDGAKTGMNGAQAEMEALRARLSDFGGILSERRQEAVDTVRDNVRQQPLVSLGIAFAAGYIASLILSGRR